MSQDVQKIQLPRISTKPLKKVFLQVIIYFRLEMRFFFLKEKKLFLCIKEVNFLYEDFLNAQRTSLKASFKENSSNITFI